MESQTLEKKPDQVRVDELLSKGLNNLPSPPIVVQRLNTRLGQEDVSSHEIASIIETDQSFTVRILKLVNSPFYGFARKIVSVEEAITMLGFNAVQQLVFTTSVLSRFKFKNKRLDLGEFWRHSFGVGIIGKHLLMKNRRLQNEGFLCGILHDIGRLLFLTAVPEKFASFYFRGSMMIDLETEREAFGINHQQFGEILAQKWNLPDSLATVIGNHHTPLGAIDYEVIASAVHVANLISHALNIGDSGNYFVSNFSPEAWELLGISYDDLEEVLRKAISEIEASENLLRELG
ncbi:MAG: HDOD domain-containing protein [candidate division Zixibacteria bacterium]|nr:HDOD domain-containing protein [candidate division Zixibacteria bacterium]